MKQVPPIIIAVSVILYTTWLLAPILYTSDSDPCYLYTNGKDSISMNMNITDKYVNGQLIYSFYEKDKETGSITGELHNDTLIADYIYIKKGRRLIREVIFIVKENTLTEGRGELIYSGDKMVFKNWKALSFSGNTILKKGNCNNVKPPL